MQQSTVLRIGAAIVTALGAAAGVVSQNPGLVSATLPPGAASAVSLAALLVVAVLHELAHSTTASAATAPADPAPPPQP